MAEDTTFVAREADVATLQSHWQQAREGKPQLVRLQAPFGGGRRAVMGEVLRGVQAAEDDVLIWRVACIDQENGLQWLVRMYGSLIAGLTADVLRRGKIELMLNAQLPHQPKRVQQWYQEFVRALKESKTDTEKGSVQLRMPKDNPLIGLVEVATAVSRKLPVILELQNPASVYSVLLAQFVEAMMTEGQESGGQLLIVMHDEPESDVTKSLYPMPLLDMYERVEHQVVTIEPWGADEVGQYLTSKGIEGNAAQIADKCEGRPGFVAEMVEILQDRGISGDLTDVSFASLVPLAVDASELELPDSPAEDQPRKHATPDDAGQIAYFAALLGQAFPSGIVADMGGFDRESVDDLIDAMGDLFEEVQHSEPLGTWIYKFKRGSWREGVMQQNATDEGRALAQRVGMYMERVLIPRGYMFIAKTARVYAESGSPERAGLLRSLALTNDSRDVWGLAYDLTKYFDEIQWPDPMVRTVLMNLVDNLVNAGGLEVAEKVHTDATEWANQREDRDLTAWLLLTGSRLDTRRQDLYRARDRANDALTLFKALDNKARAAEVHTHIAQIELQDGNPTAALDNVNQALELAAVKLDDERTAVAPNILAQSEYIRGMVVRRSGKPKEAVEHFQKANTVAGQSGIAALAVSAGLSLGEALLASGQFDKATQVLGQMVNITASMRNAVQERTAQELLAQALGATRNFDQAAKHAGRALELSTGLKFQQFIPIDTFNLGRFQFLNNKPTEALALFKQVAPSIPGMGKHPMVKEFHYFNGLANLRAGDSGVAKDSLRTVLGLAQNSKDWPKLVSSLGHLASIEAAAGNASVARKLLVDGMGFAKKHNLKDQRRALKRQLDAL